MYRLYGMLAVAAFILNFFWESAHQHLYTGYGTLGAPLPLSVWASFGDVFYIVGAVLLIGFFRRRLNWFAHARAADYALLATFGFFIAWYVEHKALAAYTWTYTSAMPVIPGLTIGLSPVLQMMLLLPLCTYLAAFLYRKFLEEYH